MDDVTAGKTEEDFNQEDERNTKESSSIYEKIYPMRIPLMAIGGIVFLTGLGMFIGGFAGLVADMDVKLRRTGAPNIGYLLMLIVSVVVMVAGGVSLFCGCGAIRYKRRMMNPRKNTYKEKKRSSSSPRPLQHTAAPATATAAFTSSQTRILEPNGDVTYTVSYQYRGPPPGRINGIPAYPAPPPGVSPILKIHPSKPAAISKEAKIAPLSKRPPPIHGPAQGTVPPDVPRRLVLVKRM